MHARDDLKQRLANGLKLLLEFDKSIMMALLQLGFAYVIGGWGGIVLLAIGWVTGSIIWHRANDLHIAAARRDGIQEGIAAGRQKAYDEGYSDGYRTALDVERTSQASAEAFAKREAEKKAKAEAKRYAKAERIRATASRARASFTHWVVLGIPPTNDEAAIIRAFRAQAMKAHPDHGGSTEAMKSVIDARDAALQELRTAKV